MIGVADLGAERLSRMIKGYWVSQIVRTLAQLEIADHLAHGPLNCDVLADGIGCDPNATYRLLRASADRIDGPRPLAAMGPARRGRASW